MTDERGEVVHAIEKAQTFLTEQQVNELIAQYRQGSSLRDLAAAFGVHHRTAAEHLARRGEPMRPRGLQAKFVPEATRLYESGMPLVEVGRRFGVSQGAVRHALASRGVEIRPRGRIPAAQ